MGSARQNGGPTITSIYELKPGFQALLRPGVRILARVGIQANSVTLAAMALSIGLGAFLLADPKPRHFLLLPLWMFLRMAFNAVDGILAREFGQRSRLGAYLNELTDVVSDGALYLPFVHVAPYGWTSVGAVIYLSALSEMAGVLAPMVGSERRYDGPMGKSDRAFLFGVLGLWFGLAGTLPAWVFWVLPAASALIVLNIARRVRKGLAGPSLQGPP